MPSVLWLLLVVIIPTVSPEENSKSEENDLLDEQQSRVFALADSIYNGQIECESMVEEAVSKIIEEGVNHKSLIPDERYVQCKKHVNEMKREYIKTALLGLNYYSTVFPMRLSYGRVVILPVPVEQKEEEKHAEFDVQEELCATNRICLNIVDNMYSNMDAIEDPKELSEKFSHCSNLLNDMKLKYIHKKMLDEAELRRAQGLSVMCAEKAIMFTLPQINDADFSATSHSMGPFAPEIMPSYENAGSGKESKEPVGYHYPYSEVTEELKSIIKKAGKDQQDSGKYITSDQLRENGHNAQEETEIRDKARGSESIMQEDQGQDETAEITKNISLLPGNEKSDNNNEPEKSNLDGETNKDKRSPHKEQNISNSASSPNNDPEEILNTEKELENNSSPGGSLTESINNDEETNQTKSSKTIKPINKKPFKSSKSKHDENVKLVTYRVNLVSKNGEGKVVRIQASGRIKKTESAKEKSDSSQRPQSTNLDSKSDDEIFERIPESIQKSFTPMSQHQKGDEVQRRIHSESLEDNIIMMENDCKQLLTLGEQLMQHKMLSSLINFENQYNECIGKLDELKKMYIEKHRVDVMSHKNIFPLTLPNGVQKLVLLPTQFLKTEMVESLSPSQLKTGDDFELGEFYHKSDKNENLTLKSRNPFDDPAFISNDEFLESLKQGSVPSDTSTLSRVANMLHMNGGHSDKKTA